MQSFLWKLRSPTEGPSKVFQGPNASQDLQGGGPGAAEAMGESLRSCQALLCRGKQIPTQNRSVLQKASSKSSKKKVLKSEFLHVLIPDPFISV